MGELLYLKGEYDESLHILNQLKLIEAISQINSIYSPNLYQKGPWLIRHWTNIETCSICPHRHGTALKGFVEIIELDPLNESAYKLFTKHIRKKVYWTKDW